MNPSVGYDSLACLQIYIAVPTEMLPPLAIQSFNGVPRGLPKDSLNTKSIHARWYTTPYHAMPYHCNANSIAVTLIIQAYGLIQYVFTLFLLSALMPKTNNFTSCTHRYIHTHTANAISKHRTPKPLNPYHWKFVFCSVRFFFGAPLSLFTLMLEVTHIYRLCVERKYAYIWIRFQIVHTHTHSHSHSQS